MKIIEVIADSGHIDTVAGIAEQQAVVDIWYGPEGEDGRRSIRLLVGDNKRQNVLDALQAVLATSETASILVIPVDAALPAKPSVESTADNDRATTTLSREELYSSIQKNTNLDRTFLLLVFLSTIVVAIGLLHDNVAVVIGAMVIAPLLGPNIAFAFCR